MKQQNTFSLLGFFPVVPGSRVSMMQLDNLDRIGTCYSLTPGLIHPCLSPTIFPLKTTTEKQNETAEHLQSFWGFSSCTWQPSFNDAAWRFRQNRNLLQFNTRFDSSLLESNHLPLKNNNIETKWNSRTPSVFWGFFQLYLAAEFQWCSLTI